MGLVPTVKVADDAFERGYKIIAEEDFDPDEHERYVEGYSYELAKNGFWTIYSGEEEVDSGRKKEALSSALEDLGTSLESAERLE